MTNEQLQEKLQAARIEWGNAAKSITAIELVDGVVCSIKATRLEKAQANYEYIKLTIQAREEMKAFFTKYADVTIRRY